MLTIDRATYDAIVAHAKRDHPDEACGVVAGPEGSDRPERFVEMVNAAGSRRSTSSTPPTSSSSTRRWTRTTRSRSSSTTRTPPPRRTRAATDIGLASEPNAHYVLVSTREHGNNDGPVEFRSYRIVDGDVTEEEVRVVDELPESN